MNESVPNSGNDYSLERITQLEQRLARIEARLGLTLEGSEGVAESPATVAPPAGLARSSPTETLAAVAKVEDEREFEVGQSWFANAGILALTVGIGFMLSLPHADLPAAIPSLLGFLVVGLLLGVTHLARRTLEMVANPLRGAAMALLMMSAWRLYFPAARPVLGVASNAGQALLLVVVVATLALAWQRRSGWLVGFALALGGATALFVGAPGFVLAMVAGVAVVAVVAGERGGWPGLTVAAMPLAYGTYLVWAIGNPLHGGAVHFVSAPTIAPAIVLLSLAGFAIGMLRRGAKEPEDNLGSVAAFINCSLGYGLFLIHTAATQPESLVAAHTGAAAVLIGLAVVFWVRQRSHVATFFYAMTGYAALSVAIIKASAMPQVFIWLSLQSVLVVATAIWFRSRFIVVANFLIFVAIMLGYVIVAQSESGISLGLGIVALISARILNWQKERLELKTELMRNAYLLSAFTVFPYALSHLVSGRYVPVAWVALGSLYYGLNLLTHSPKYRWMGHGTLGLATIYAVIAGVSRFDPIYRILTFLALGTVLLIVAVSFNRALRRRTGKTPVTEHS